MISNGTPSTSNGDVGPMPMKERKQLGPIDAFETDNDQHVLYADILPSTQLANDKGSGSNHQHGDVTYAELAPTEQPVVNADNNA